MHYTFQARQASLKRGVNGSDLTFARCANFLQPRGIFETYDLKALTEQRPWKWLLQCFVYFELLFCRLRTGIGFVKPTTIELLCFPRVPSY